MNLMSQSPALPFWVVAPPTILVMLFLAGHVMGLQQMAIDSRRKRIRSVNGVLMIFTAALLAHALAIISPSDSRTFLLTWMIIIALLGFIILLASFDALNTYAVYRQSMSSSRETIHDLSMSPLSHEATQTDG